jgi:hypothetical protein
VGMKALSAGQLVRDRAATVDECVRYAATLTDTVIIGCSSVEEVRENLAAGDHFNPMSAADMRALEQRLAHRAGRYAYFKG